MNDKKDNTTNFFNNNKNDKSVITDDLNFQHRLIKNFLEDESFSTQIIDILKPSYFDNIYHKILYKYIVDYIEKYNSIPNYDTIKILINEREPESMQRDRLIEIVDKILNTQDGDMQYIQDYALDFCRKQSLKEGLEKAAESWANNDYESISTIINDALKSGEPKDIGHDYIEDVEKRMVKEHRNPIRTISGLDTILGGGLAGGELGIIMSPTGGGKSMMLVKFATRALEEGKKVAYYTLELSEKVIGNRIDSCLTTLSLSNITSMDGVVKEKIEKVKKLGGGIMIKEFPTGTATVNTLKAHLKVLKREKNFVPDIIFIDYADIMKAVSQQSERRFNLTSIYEGIRGLAMELKVPVWTACQANRSAINEDRFDLKAISESLGKAQTADVILGLARTEENKKVGEAQLMILKNRNGEDGMSEQLEFDTSTIKINFKFNKKKKDINDAILKKEEGYVNNMVDDSKSYPQDVSDII